jgi:hypothetical protein
MPQQVHNRHPSTLLGVTLSKVEGSKLAVQNPVALRAKCNQSRTSVQNQGPARRVWNWLFWRLVFLSSDPLNARASA